MSTQQRRACDSCSRKKILCDGNGGECDWCRHHGLKCTYDRPLKKRMASAAGYASSAGFKKRIERLEVALNEAQNKLGTIRDDEQRPDTTSPESASASSAWSFRNTSQLFSLGRFHLAGHHIGEISSTSCLPVFSPVGHAWVKAATGEEATFDKLRAYETQWNDSHDVSPTLYTELPPKAFVEYLASRFYSSPVYSVFPVVEQTRFQECIHQTYNASSGSVQPQLKTQVARTCVLAFLAMATLMQGAIDFALPPAGESYDCQVFGAMASDSLAYLLQEPGVDQCGALLALAIFHVMSGHEHQGAMMLSSACRSLGVLGAHTMKFKPNTDRQTIYLRKLFWVAYTMDKEISLRTGLSPCFSDDWCDLTLPQMSSLPINPEPTTISDYKLLTPTVPLMSLMKSRICRLLYSESALHKSSIETLRDIRLLDDELEQWRLVMPVEWNVVLGPATPSIHSSTSSSSAPSPESASSQSQGQGQEGTHPPQLPVRKKESHHAIMTKLGYYHLLSVVHRASGRCRASMGDDTGNAESFTELGEGISSSLAISVQASRMAICCIRDAWDSPSSYAFWVIVFYPISAVLAIFCHVLLDPISSTVQEDLALIGCVPDVVRNVGRRRKQHHERDEMFYMMVDELCTELIRLGNCAVYRAVEGQLGELSTR